MRSRRRLMAIFLRDEDGRRPVFGGIEQFQSDPHWRELLLFHEYFHGDNGAGLGASHQTGWTGLVALLFAQAARRWHCVGATRHRGAVVIRKHILRRPS